MCYLAEGLQHFIAASLRVGGLTMTAVYLKIMKPFYQT